MPITKSAQKALRQNKRRRVMNSQRSRALKEEVKKLKKLITAKDKKGAISLLPEVYKALDKASKTNVLNKNTASRIKSRLTRNVNKI